MLLSGSPEHEDLITTTDPSPVLPSVNEEHRMAESYLKVWEDSQVAIKRHLYRGKMFIYPHYIQADLHTGATRAFWFDSLSAFYPGLLTLAGNLDEAADMHLLLAALWTRYSALPERWSTTSGSVESGLGWWGGRPEFIESTYHLYHATHDPWYLHVGEMVLRDIKRRCWTKCGWSGIQDVRTGERSDRMESFFLGETTKYLFLLFSPDHPLNKLDAPFVFSTEGHPLILPRQKRNQSDKSSVRNHTTRPVQKPFDGSVTSTCSVPPAMLPFSISATAARKDLFHAANLARLHLMPTPEILESPIVEYSRDHPSISISDVRSPSNYTYFPWTLPLNLVPSNGTCSKITSRTTFDITFPPTPNASLGSGILQRVLDGILVNSMGGVRLGLIQDVPAASGTNIQGEMYRVHAINNILLGKDERIFLSKETASSVVNPLDPNFTRVRDTSMLDLVIDVSGLGAAAEKPRESKGASTKNQNSTVIPDIALPEVLDDNSASPMLVAFSSLLQQLTGLIREYPVPVVESSSRKYIAAITPTGVGAAPLPDVEDALGPDMSGSPQGSLLWRSIFVAGDNCHERLSSDIPKEHQIIVIMRGGCSFSEKLRNIPTFVPSPTSLQLVVVVSHDEEKLPPGYLIRPWLETAQYTATGLPRHNPIPMVMVGGGKQTYETFRHAIGLGIKRRYTIQAQGVPISNVIII